MTTRLGPWWNCESTFYHSDGTHQAGQQGSAAIAGIAQIEDSLSQSTLKQLVQAAARLDCMPCRSEGCPRCATWQAGIGSDTAGGQIRLPTELRRPTKESMTLKWWILELLPFRGPQNRPHSSPEDRRWTWGAGRQMRPYQKVHGSVLRILQARKAAIPQDREPTLPWNPRARLPEQWGLRPVSIRSKGLWEV
jgi:hypothetical protein